MKKIYVVLLFLLFSQQALAISVDKMIVISKGNNEASNITVLNEDTYPVFVKAELSELMPDGKSKSFENKNFKQWPIYLNHMDFIIDPKSKFKVTVNNLQEMLGNKETKDRILGISFVPESYKKNDESEKSLNILTGFKVWYIIPNNLDKVTGDITFKEIENHKYYLYNNTNTVLTFNINACKAMGLSIGNSCNEKILILAGKKKVLNFTEVKKGDVFIEAQDYRNRFDKKLTIKIK
ncbi:hypothetical protein [Photobacterium kishitanii]|uniref:hypothetical protein n=1 Tax=Photobacterium kishitanii TaxID=318456 RepID=UPI000435DD51|nr:hypothetical protein [Photobacterium kishitanii]CEO41864.1 conserved exported hypothetical protein [Photobacterium kishitanii]